MAKEPPLGKPAVGLEWTWNAVRMPGYAYGDDAIPHPPLSFSYTVPVMAAHIRHLDRRKGWLQ